MSGLNRGAAGLYGGNTGLYGGNAGLYSGSAGLIAEAGSSPIPIPAPFASVNGGASTPYESWSVDYASKPTLSANVEFTVSRQGYTAAGATTTYLDSMYVVKTTSPGGAVRKPYPDQGTQSDLTAALSDYIYSTDTPSGSVTNNSTFISPKPIANWATPARRLVGDTIGGDTVPVEVVAFHRNARGGKQVACVVFTISDGTNPDVTATVSTAEISTYPGDLHPVIVYKLPATDVSSLNTGTLTVNAKVYPWIGAAASVLNSADQSERREFSPRYFYKNTTKFNSPDIMYVNSSTGNDATAQVNSTGSPAATIMGAINRMRTGSTGAPWNIATTKIVLANDATHPFTGNGSGNSTGTAGALLITRDPATTTLAGCLVQYGTNAIPNIDTSLPAPVTTGAIVFTNVSLTRTSTLYFARGTGTTRLEIQVDNCPCDNNSSGTTWCNVSDVYLWGVTFTNPGGGGFSGTSQGQQRIWRGVSMSPGGGNVEMWLHLGCDFNWGGTLTTVASGQGYNGLIMAFNRYGGINNSTPTGWFGVAVAITTGLAIVQNVVEYIKGGTVTHSLGISNDATTTAATNCIIHNNTWVGSYEAGRWNLFYDDGATTKSNTLHSVVGNIAVAFYIKSDVFKTNGGFIGNWGPMYGCGMRGNMTMMRSNSALGGVQAPAYEGIESSWGTDNLTRNDPLFTTFAATTNPAGVYTAGAGGGDYTVSIASPANGLLADPVLPFDFAGNARPTTNDTAGAYVAPWP